MGWESNPRRSCGRTGLANRLAFTELQSHPSTSYHIIGALAGGAPITSPFGCGRSGDDGCRTHCLLVADEALYQLSYIPDGDVIR